MDSYLVVTVTEATKLLRISKPTLYRYLQKDPTFPKPIFTLNIRQPKLFYGSPEVRQLNYQNFNNNKFKA